MESLSVEVYFYFLSRHEGIGEEEIGGDPPDTFLNHILPSRHWAKCLMWSLDEITLNMKI